MKKRSGREKKLDAYIDTVKAHQQNLTWLSVLRGGRSVDHFLWKGVSDAPLVQRIGVLVLAVAYFIVALAFVAIAFDQKNWFMGLSATVLFGVGGWFIRNAFRRLRETRHIHVEKNDTNE